MSSTTITDRPAILLLPRTANAPERLWERPPTDNPAWSETGRTTRRRGSTRAGTPADRNARPHSLLIRSSGSWPRSRTILRVDGAGMIAVTPAAGGAARDKTPKTLRARARPSGLARERRASSLWATSAARGAASYSATAKTGGRPGGHGDGCARKGSPSSLDPQRRHSGGPGRPHPAQEPPSTRSTEAERRSREFDMCSPWATPKSKARPSRRPVDHRRLPADGGCAVNRGRSAGTAWWSRRTAPTADRPSGHRSRQPSTRSRRVHRRWGRPRCSPARPG